MLRWPGGPQAPSADTHNAVEEKTHTLNLKHMYFVYVLGDLPHGRHSLLLFLGFTVQHHRVAQSDLRKDGALCSFYSVEIFPWETIRQHIGDR